MPRSIIGAGGVNQVGITRRARSTPGHLTVTELYASSPTKQRRNSARVPLRGGVGTLREFGDRGGIHFAVMEGREGVVIGGRIVVHAAEDEVHFF